MSVDDLYFEEKIKLGEILSFTAQVNRVFNTSMEVSISIEFYLQLKPLHY